MKLKSIFTNKYTLSVIILLTVLGIDVLLHKGMSRVLIPDSFTSQRGPLNYNRCKSFLQSSNKHWQKAVNNLEKAALADTTLGGIEIDVYFDTAKNRFLVYHDTAGYTQLTLQDLLTAALKKHPKLSVWLDFKNLSAGNESQSLARLQYLQKANALRQRIIVESSSPQYLQSFCSAGFYTSFYAPYFNPYVEDENQLIAHLDSISNALKNYPVNAISGYYFQYPVLKRYFPSFPLLTWTNDAPLSIVGNTLNYTLLHDDHVKVVLFP